MSALKETNQATDSKEKEAELSEDPNRIFQDHPHVTHPNEMINQERRGLTKFNYWLAELEWLGQPPPCLNL